MSIGKARQRDPQNAGGPSGARGGIIRRIIGGFFLYTGGIHLGLMLFGWGFWLWSVPALAIIIPAARRDWHSRQTAGPLR